VDEAERKRIANALAAVHSALTHESFVFRSTGRGLDTQESDVELIVEIAKAAGLEIDVTSVGTMASRLTVRNKAASTLNSAI
jgi:predicted nucleotidyltransferase